MGKGDILALILLLYLLNDVGAALNDAVLVSFHLCVELGGELSILLSSLLKMLSDCIQMSCMNVISMSKATAYLGNPAWLQGHIRLNDAAPCKVAIDFIDQRSYAIDHIYRLTVV